MQYLKEMQKKDRDRNKAKPNCRIKGTQRIIITEHSSKSTGPQGWQRNGIASRLRVKDHV